MILVLNVFLLSCAGRPDTRVTTYDGGDGPYQVDILDDVVIKDPARSRDIPVKIYYPEGKGPFPVILFSHGLGGSKEGGKYLGRFWASHGYISIHMTHFGSDTSLLDRSKSLEDNIPILRKATENPAALSDRPRDVSRTIDFLPEMGKTVAPLRGKIDTSAIGVSGHSFGAFTVMISAGAFGNQARLIYRSDFKDPRPKAFLAMSPQAVRHGLDPKAVFGGIDRPLMTMTGSNDVDPIRQQMTGKDRLQPYENMPAGDKYSLWIDGAYHWTFGDGRGRRTPDPEHHRYIKMASLAFWDAYLKNSDSAKAFLKSKTLDKISKGKASLDYK